MAVADGIVIKCSVSIFLQKKFWSLFFRLPTCLHLFVVLALTFAHSECKPTRNSAFHILFSFIIYFKWLHHLYILEGPLLVKVANQRTAQGSQFSTPTRARTKVGRLSFICWAISLASFSFTLIILRLLEDTYKVVYFKRKDIIIKLRIKNIKINTTFPSENISNGRCFK